MPQNQSKASRSSHGHRVPNWPWHRNDRLDLDAETPVQTPENCSITGSKLNLDKFIYLLFWNQKGVKATSIERKDSSLMPS